MPDVSLEWDIGEDVGVLDPSCQLSALGAVATATVKALYDILVLVVFSCLKGVQEMIATSSTQLWLMLSNQS